MDVQFVAIETLAATGVFFFKGRTCKETGGPLPTPHLTARHGIAMPRGVVLAVMGKAYGTLKGSDPLKQLFCHF